MGLHKLSIPRPSLISSISSRRHTSHTINHDDELVCVTGTCGSLGTWIVKLLLQEGYSVRSTIPHTAEEVSLLLATPGANDHLDISTVDVLDYGNLSEIFHGCNGVFYVPSPNYDINGARDCPKETIDNEVGGVLNVVEACANTHSVTKLVLTSCLSTILWDRQYYLEETSVVLDEKNWTDLDFCRKKKLWSALCKTLAEKAAWALARDKGLDLIVMNPATVLARSKTNVVVNNNLQRLLDQSGIFAFVYVDDLAKAHILTYQAEGASGRYICFEKLLSKADIVEAANQMYPNYPMAAKRLESFNPCVLSNEKLKSLQVSCGYSSIEAQGANCNDGLFGLVHSN